MKRREIATKEMVRAGVDAMTTFCACDEISSCLLEELAGVAYGAMASEADESESFSITPTAIKAGADILRVSIVCKDEYDMGHLHDLSGDPEKDECAEVVLEILRAASLARES